MTFRIGFSRAACVALAASLALACTTNPYTGERQIAKTASGAGIGALTGAAIGALAGTDNRGQGALIGAGAGAVAGGAVGGYMDVQEKKLRERLQGSGVGVDRDGDEIVLNMPGNVTFASDSDQIQPSFWEVLSSVSLVVKEYDKTALEIAGHTDGTGSDAYNDTLAERRAASVGQYLIGQGIDPRRIATRGYGKNEPIADNATASGRQKNRRVELRLVPTA
jgi:outer membrane protein OmpA-like peptidoglycan-associated protein